MVNVIFEVGEKEKHSINVTACTIREILEVLVDDKVIFSATAPQPYRVAQFQIGELEKHSIEVILKGTFASTIELHVDGRLYAIA
jgi:hypothetical protein